MVKLSNYNKRTPERWRRIADAGLVAIPTLQAAIIALPLADGVKAWTMLPVALLLVAFKFITKFLEEDK